LHVDVVGDQGDPARADLGAKRASGIGQDQDLAAERLQRAHRHVDRARRHALVEMHATLQTGHWQALQPPQNHAAVMTLDRRTRESGQIGIGHGDRTFQVVGKCTEPGAQNQPDPGLEIRRCRLDHVDRRAWRRGGDIVAEREGQRQQLAQRHGTAQATRIAEMNQRVRRAELAKALPAAAAGCAQALAGRDHQDLHDPPFAGCDHRCERARLGAIALRKAGVLDIGAGEDPAAGGAHGSAHLKMGIGRMGVTVSDQRRVEQISHRSSCQRLPSGRKSNSRRARSQAYRLMRLAPGS
jgi:hypothetical protein